MTPGDKSEPIAEKRTSSSKLPGLVAYMAFLLVAVMLVLELFARFGLPESQYYRTRHVIKNAAPPVVLLLGDSFSGESEGSFATRTRGLAESLGSTLVNVAASGMGPEQYVRQASLYAEDASPDLFLLNYFVGNDLTDTIHFRNTPLTQGIKSLSSSLYLGHVLAATAARMKTRFRMAQVRRRFPKEVDTLYNPLLLEAAKELPTFMLDNLLVASSEARTAWDRNRELLTDLSVLARDSQASILMTIIPANLQVSDRDLETMRKVGFRIDSSLVGTRIPQDLLLEFCRQQRISCIDLLPVFLDHGEVTTYLAADLHWNAEGHRLAFETVRPHLTRMLVSGRAP